MAKVGESNSSLLHFRKGHQPLPYAALQREAAALAVARACVDPCQHPALGASRDELQLTHTEGQKVPQAKSLLIHLKA